MTPLRNAVTPALALACLVAAAVHAAADQTLLFSYTDPGIAKPITDWGADVAMSSADNLRQTLAHVGADEIDVLRIHFYTDEPLQTDGSLGPHSRARLDDQLALAATVGAKPLSLVPHLGDPTPASPDLWAGSHPYYFPGGSMNLTRWTNLIRATRQHVADQGWTVAAVEPFNEPDYNRPDIGPPEQGTRQNLLNLMYSLQTDADFSDIALLGPSTRSSAEFSSWYNVMSGPSDYGVSHQRAGSADDYVSFIQQTITAGDTPYNSEIHSIAEMLYGAEHGLGGGVLAGPSYLARGHLVDAIASGQRLAYAEDRTGGVAAAVYRDPHGVVRAFAGGFEGEDQGDPTTYRLVSTDQNVYFNGVGPMREYMIRANQGTHGSYVDVRPDASGLPALDGHRWKIVEASTDRVLQVQGASLTDGANVEVASALAPGAPDFEFQAWDVVRNADQQTTGYYQLINAGSGRSAETPNQMLGDNVSIWQNGTGETPSRQWYIEPAENGAFYLRNGYSHQYLTAEVAGSDAYQFQYAGAGATHQQWRFVLANPALADSTVLHYELGADTNSSVGAAHASPSGGPTHVPGQLGDALDLDGLDDYLTLPAGIADTAAITVAAWVQWDGGAAGQRIFDFGASPSESLYLTPSDDAGMMRFAINDNGAEQYLQTTSLPVGEWVHLALTLGGDTAVLYVNGQPRVAGQVTLDPADLQPTLNYIGKGQDAGPLLDARIDDFRIYDYALHASQIPDLLGVALSTLPGDFNGDHTVDALDYAVWRENAGLPEDGVRLSGNGDGGQIDDGDYLLWLANYGATTAGGGSAPQRTPEPAAAALLVLAIAVGAARRLRVS